MFQDRREGDVLHREDHVALMAFPLLGTERGPGGEGRPPDHVRDQLIVARVRDAAAGHAAAIAQHGVAAGDLAHFFQEMADIDDRDAARRELPDQGEQAIHVLALQAAGRLVHQEDARVGGEGAADLHHLLRREGQVAYAGLWVQRGTPELLEQRDRAAPRCSPVHPAAPGRLETEQHVLRRAQVGTEAQLLVNECDASVARVPGTGRRVRPAIDLHRAAIGPDGGGDDVHEGGLTGAVFPDQGVHLARPEREIHAIQRPSRSESLGDVANLEQRGHGSVR